MIDNQRGKIVKEYLGLFPEKPSLTLAKLIQAKYPDMGNSELWRDSIRYYRGSHGKRDRKTQGFIRPPESHAKEWNYYIIPECYKNTLVLSDIHVPNHDRQAIELAINEAIKRDVDSVILNGDYFDFYQISRFSKNPSYMGIVKELEIGNELLDYIQEMLPKSKIIFKEGNHDERLDKFINEKCSELYGLPNLNLVSQIEAKNRGMLYVNDQRIMKYGHLHILHGHEINGFSGVNPARALYNKVHTTALAGHLHRSGTHHEPDLNRTFTACWTMGCNCELSPEFSRVNAWNLGHTFIERDKNDFKLENYKIINGKVYNA
jgi:predicted phosphodiesterase